VLVVGDAAGLTKPTTGGGIYYGLLSAEFAAHAARHALATADFSAECLAQYQRTWKAQFGRDLWWGRWFRRHAEQFTDAQIDDAFRLATWTRCHRSFASTQCLTGTGG
jgi:flavin-dependent dehydrogenase